jgi:hypothetical protein
VNWDLSAPSAMSADAYVSSTWLDSARTEKAVRMLIPDGRKTSHDQRCAPRRQRKSWNTRKPSSGKNKNARRNGKGNGEARGGGVVVSAVGASVGEAGVSWTHIGLFYGPHCMVWSVPRQGGLFYGFVGPVDTPIWI